MTQNSSTKNRFELIIELIQVVAWPFVVLILVTSFWAPLHKIANLIPSLISRSDSITIAGLSLQVSKNLRARTSEDVEATVAKLSPDGIKKVLALSDTSYWDRDSIEYAKESMKELVELGIVKRIPENKLLMENSRSSSNHGYGVATTDLGYRTQDFLRLIVSEFVDKLAGAENI